MSVQKVLQIVCVVAVFAVPVSFCTSWTWAAECPKIKRLFVSCPTEVHLCSQCPMGWNCTDCVQDQVQQDYFKCTDPDPSYFLRTKCVKKTSAGQDVYGICKKPFKCKAVAGGCGIDLSQPLQPTNMPLMETQDC